MASLYSPAPAVGAFDFAGKRIVILGLARQGLALARFFVAAGARVTVSDIAPAEKLSGELNKLGNLPVQLALGGHPLTLLEQCDLLCLSGGVPPQLEIVQMAIRQGVPLSNDSLLTLQLARQRGLGPVIAITGSSGKTTTTTLVGKMLEASHLPVHVGGNIGRPLLDRLDTVRPGERIVLELSSFQLELFDSVVAWGTLDDLGPDVAAILNITPNHLDRHPSMAAYAAAKLNLLRHLRPATTVVVSADDAVTGQLLNQQAKVNEIPPEWKLETLLNETASVLRQPSHTIVGFSRSLLSAGAWLENDDLRYNGQTFCQRRQVKLRGDHNISNLLAAAAISGAAGAGVTAIGEVARSFTGVPHRLEIVADVGGITWINDSIATAPERALAALRSFDPQSQTLILLAGGKDKNLPWQTFVDEVLKRVSFLIGFGQAGPMIVDTVQQRAALDHRRGPGYAVVQRLEDAVELAARSALPGSVVLLSPGGASYDAYRDFEERGEHFRRLVQEQIEQMAQMAVVS